MFSEANTGVLIQVKLVNRDAVQASHSEELLKEADLESHGYTKEITTKLVKGPSSRRSYFQVCYYFMKIGHLQLAVTWPAAKIIGYHLYNTRDENS